MVQHPHRNAPADDSAPPWDLIARYDRPLPRYTSYPTVPAWGAFDLSEADAAFARSRDDNRPISLYVHVPFCDRMCLYCGCNVVVTRSRDKMERYIDALEHELQMLHGRVGDKQMVQLHFGGGTPTMLLPRELDRLIAAIFARFAPTPNAEMSIELDPVVTTAEHLEVVRARGLNRLSIGVQDFDPDIQQEVERGQSVQDAQRIFDAARRLGFDSVNVDLIYGLPTQTPDHLERSARTAIEMGADRLAIFGYAHVPWMKPHQKKLEVHGIPQQRERWQMAMAGRAVLVDEGFAPIGLDHFARPTDELAVAASERRLWRNFQGYTVLDPTDLLAIGVSSIADVGGCYVQNLKRMSDYYGAVDSDRLALDRGMRRSAADDLRRLLINSIMCNLYVDLDQPAFVGEDFTTELAALAPLADDGLVEIDGRTIRVPGRGRVFVRNVASVFDTYLGNQQDGGPKFSRSV